VKVRAATAADVEFLVDGNARMAWETEGLTLDRERLRAGVAAVFAESGRGFYLIAELDGIAIGQMMITYEWSDWRNGVFWWIQSVFTLPEWRGRGAFKALYAAVEEMGRKQGDVCGLRLYVEAHNAAAQETYKRCGMSETVYRMFEVDSVLGRR
jgi:GNAT superfamily N-acetyltransferase